MHKLLQLFPFEQRVFNDDRQKNMIYFTYYRNTTKKIVIVPKNRSKNCGSIKTCIALP